MVIRELRIFASSWIICDNNSNKTKTGMLQDAKDILFLMKLVLLYQRASEK